MCLIFVVVKLIVNCNCIGCNFEACSTFIYGQSHSLISERNVVSKCMMGKRVKEKRRIVSPNGCVVEYKKSILTVHPISCMLHEEQFV